MNSYRKWALKVDAVMAFLDLKVFLLVVLVLNLYRSTMLLNGIPGVQIRNIGDVLHYIWETCGAPFVLWIPLLAIADVLLKRAIKSMLE